MSKDDELSSRRMKTLLREKWPDVHVSIPTIKRTRKDMGWVCTKPHYCQLIREVRKSMFVEYLYVKH